MHRNEITFDYLDTVTGKVQCGQIVGADRRRLAAWLHHPDLSACHIESTTFLRSKVQTPLEVLRSATVVNAELLSRAGELGVVAPGAHADICLSRAIQWPISRCSPGTRRRCVWIVRGGAVVVNELSR